MSLKNQDETIKGKIRKAFSLSEDSASHEEIKERLLDGGQVTGTNMCVLVCAMVIASVGLNVSSTAVIKSYAWFWNTDCNQCCRCYNLFSFVSG